MFNLNNLYNFLKSSDELSQNLPNLLSASSSLSKNILDGLHSTSFAGRGESFWQFREYQQGDTVTNIDWRKSASSKKILIKEKEKEISKNIFIYFDKSKSMHYKSSEKLKNKFFISVLLSLTLCRLFSRSSEEVYLFNEKNIPVNCSNNIGNFKSSFLLEKNHSLPNPNYIKENSFFIIFSDFLYEITELSNFISKLKDKNVIGYLVQVLDPMELDFDFIGHNELVDMETKERLVFGNNNSFSNDYKKRFEVMKKKLIELCILNNWTNSRYTTNVKPAEILLDIANKIIVNKRKN